MKKLALSRPVITIGAFLLLSFHSAQFLFGQNAPGIEWEKSLGGSSNEEAGSVQELTNGDFIVVGQSGSNDGDVSTNHGSDDFWAVRLNSDGDTIWTKCFGGSGSEQYNKVERTNDGGFIIVGLTTSNDGDVSGNHGAYDSWVVKLDSLGIMEWQKCLGGSNDDYGQSICQTSDGGYIMTSSTFSFDGDVSGNHGQGDYWIVKLNSSGDTVWTRCYGGSGNDDPYTVIETTDGGFMVIGRSGSNDGDVTGNHGYYDYWVLKLSSNGDIAWSKCLGGTDIEQAFDIAQTSDGGYVVCGAALSTNGDVTGNHGQGDYWIVKLDESGNMEWQHSYGGSEWEQANSVQQTSDGGFIVAGWTTSNNFDVSGFHGSDDYWIVKLDTSGSMEWSKCLGGSSSELASQIRQTNEGGYIIAGKSVSNDGDVSGNHGQGDYWIVKLSGEATGIKIPVSTFSFSISPNPTEGNFLVEFSEEITLSTPLHQHTTLYITNLLEQKLFEEEIPENSSQQVFDFSQWEKGMYFIIIRNENSFCQKQLVIQ